MQGTERMNGSERRFPPLLAGATSLLCLTHSALLQRGGGARGLEPPMAAGAAGFELSHLGTPWASLPQPEGGVQARRQHWLPVLCSAAFQTCLLLFRWGGHQGNRTRKGPLRKTCLLTEMHFRSTEVRRFLFILIFCVFSPLYSFLPKGGWDTRKYTLAWRESRTAKITSLQSRCMPVTERGNTHGTVLPRWKK